MSRSFIVIVLVLLIVYMPAVLASSTQKSIVFIFDTSKSMADDNKLELAKNASINALEQIEDAEFALISFSGCNINLSVNWTTNKELIKSAISNFKAEGYTPITKSLSYAYKLLNKRADLAKKAYVIIFTDGVETCYGDPCALVKEYGNTTKVPIYTIGYIVGQEAKNQLQCIAHYSGGKYLEAPTPEEINEVLSQVTEIIEDKNRCLYDTDCEVNEVCVNGRCLQAKLHLVFVPVNWLSDEYEFDKEVKKQTKFFLYSIPSLKNCTDMIKVSKSGNCNFAINSEGSIEDLEKIEDCAFKEYSKFDFAIGIGESGIFDGGIAGYTASKKSIFIERGRELILAHEMGHKFGLVDEYCYCPDSIGCGGGPNPLKAEYGCDVNGDCCWEEASGQICMIPGSGKHCRTGYEKYGCYMCCEGNKNELGGISIMSWADAPGPRYHDIPSLEHLKNDPRLRCD